MHFKKNRIFYLLMKLIKLKSSYLFLYYHFLHNIIPDSASLATENLKNIYFFAMQI